MIKLFSFCIVVMCSWSGFAFAQTITPTQLMSFGTGVVRNNDAVYDVTVTTAGGMTYDFNVISIVDGQEGIYGLTGYNTNSSLNASILQGSITLSCGCGSPDFTVDTFTLNPNIPLTDGAGAATINLGATLHTSGLGGSYSNAGYTGTLTLRVDN